MWTICETRFVAWQGCISRFPCLCRCNLSKYIPVDAQSFPLVDRLSDDSGRRQLAAASAAGGAAARSDQAEKGKGCVLGAPRKQTGRRVGGKTAWSDQAEKGEEALRARRDGLEKEAELDCLWPRWGRVLGAPG